MEQLKHRDSNSFCDRKLLLYQVLHHITGMTGL